MTKIETLKNFLRGMPVERRLASFWGHFFKEEQQWTTLLDATVDFQKAFEWDFVKINPSSTFVVEEWGNRYRKFDSRRSEIIETRIKSAGDFRELEHLNPRAGLLGDHLKLIRGIAQQLKDVPLVMTIFSPLSYAGRLCGGAEKLKRFMTDGAHQDILRGLSIITETIAEYAVASLEAGSHGIFYATTDWGSRDLLNREEYEEFGAPFDIKILDSVKDKSMFTIFHVCKSNNRIKDLLNYPVDALNWDALDPTNPTLQEIADLSGKIVIGGISANLLSDMKNRDEVEKEITDFFNLTMGRTMLGPGCTFSGYDKALMRFIKDNSKGVTSA